jgi:uncharacterized protein YyaL (SSP411 family)
VLLRLKEDYDGAEPAASSVAALNALTIAHLTGDDAARSRAGRTLGRYGPRAGAAARTIPMMLCALSAWHSEHAQVVVAGRHAAARALTQELARRYLPFAIVIPIEPGSHQDAVARVLPFTASMNPGADRAAAYVCRDFSCRQPATTVEELARELDQISASRLELVKSLDDDDV